VKPDAAFGGPGPVPLPVSPAVTDGLGIPSLTRNDKMTTRRVFQQPGQKRPAPGLHGNVSVRRRGGFTPPVGPSVDG